MTRKLKIDFVSDIACPWCAVGLGGLEKALDAVADEITADISFHPFELNPNMPAGGQNGMEHIGQKYGMAPEKVRANRDVIRERAAAVGFVMNTSDDSRIYNTFDAHRLLAWAKEEGRQLDLKRRLLALNFTDQADPGDHDALVAAAEEVGLDGAAARLGFAQPLVPDQSFGNLVADPVSRIERGHGLLKDHRQRIAAQVTHFGIFCRQQIASLQHHAAADLGSALRQ